MLALALTFTGAVLVTGAIDIADAPLEEDVRAGQVEGPVTEQYTGSGLQKTLSVGLYFGAGAAAAIAAICALMVAVGGRFNRVLMPAAGVAVGLGAVGVALNNI